MHADIPPAIQTVLDRLHAQAAQDAGRWRERDGGDGAVATSAGGGDLVRLGEFYLAVSPDEGRLLHILARACGAKRVVEFGASFGISSLYLAAALGKQGGHLTTTEVHPDKCASLRRTFDEAGVSQTVTLLEGDARETLAEVDAPIDMLVLDGWKSMYLPVFTLLRPKLAPGCLIVADNINHAAAADYLAHMRGSEGGAVTTVIGDLALSYVTP
ncbi:class I SAM-dependent methyltransferase [Maritimibacter sp. UBA3975]|uniref:O-methyltransferase n=1 Tax=Maritimibacter sp. UBA3975 TaxID=1946833 RepID=UPI000C0B756E|nr:class I SAM-dependent methyltransferase [Maritimibacter sp. UBA3975]MAM61790.1 methyltransferase [Maritimibacter sp.]|tara:strand:- start:8451 stop:9092 length:642 start_codon:yes stop_codon:yes gene_type:complete